MTGILKSIALLAVTATLLTVAECTKLCDSGYEGKTCSVEVRAVFEGTWRAVDTPGNLVYQDTISPAGNISGLTLSSSFAKNYFIHPINATAGQNTVTIPLQQPDSIVNRQVQGTGAINNSGTVIIWTYQLIDATDSPSMISNYGGTWTK